jgi:glycosidase
MKNPDFFKRDAAGKVVTTGYHFSRLNFGNERLREYLWANMAHWVEDCQVDGFRCDTCDEVPLDFWEEARTRLDTVRPDLVLLGEGYKPTNQVKAFDIEYSLGSWYYPCETVVARGESATVLRAAWEKTHTTFPRGARFIRFADNHDHHRAAVVFGERGATALSVVNFTLDGVPFLYNGQEIDDATPLNLFAHWPIRWEARCLPQTLVKREFYRRLCQFRRTQPALTDGQLVWLANDRPDSVLSFLRRTGKQEIVAVVNLTSRKLTVEIDVPGGHPASYSPVLPGLAYGRAGLGTHLLELNAVHSAAGSGRLVFDLGSFGFFVGKREDVRSLRARSP